MVAEKTKQEAIDVLESAAFVIRGGFWTQGALARDKRGGETLSGADPKAACWCASGALLLAAKDLGVSPDSASFAEETADRFAERTSPHWNSVLFNDEPGRTASEVADLLDAAAQRLGRRSSLGFT